MLELDEQVLERVNHLCDRLKALREQWQGPWTENKSFRYPDIVVRVPLELVCRSPAALSDEM
jgi:hypothetical protein